MEIDKFTYSYHYGIDGAKDVRADDIETVDCSVLEVEDLLFILSLKWNIASPHSSGITFDQFNDFSYGCEYIGQPAHVEILGFSSHNMKCAEWLSEEDFVAMISRFALSAIEQGYTLSGGVEFSRVDILESTA